MADVLLTVSGNIAPDVEREIAEGQRPCTDYLAMAHAFHADLADYALARRESSWVGWLLALLGGPNWVLARYCFRQRHHYGVIFTDGEQVGIPFALLCKLLGKGDSQHLMIAHILSVRKKMAMMDLFQLQRYIDTFFVYASWQKQFIEQRWGVPAARVVFTPFMVDSHFFAPTAAELLAKMEQNAATRKRPLICAVGLECRDYPTLIKAVRDLEIDVVIAAASPWSKRADTSAKEALPDNVTVRKFSQYELRQLLADSAFMVMPLDNVPFQAGVTALLEAMAMGKAIICSKTPGQTDVVIDGVTGIYVPPGDVATLRSAIATLLANPSQAATMGRAGRRRIENEMSLEHYTTRLQGYVQQALQPKGDRPCATTTIQSMPPL